MNLEQFPTSETAKKMLSYITGNGFYDNSYVGKWIFQVMGEEMGDARAIIDELPLQAFVETATWGLRYHEEKYGLPIRENLSPDERRKIILEKRDLKAPMSPWRMEKIISGILGCTVDVVDINEPGSKISHPNMFIVYLEGEGEFSLGKAVEKLDEVKQSHTFYELRVRIAKFILDEKFFWKNIIRTNFTWWDACLDGRELLDGSILLDARHPPFFIPYFSIIAKNTEIFRSDVVRNRLIGSMGSYYDAYRLLRTQPLSGRYVLEELTVLTAASPKMRKEQRLKQLDGYRAYTYMRKRWEKYLRNHGLAEVPWEDAIDLILVFVSPIWESLCRNEIFFDDWMPELGRFLG